MRVVAALVLSAAIAAADGRPPLTNGVVFRPNDARTIYIRSTFGLLVSRDDGCSFRWICERAIGYGGDFDPKYAIAGDGTMFATTYKGLRTSRDGGCTWTTTGPGAIWVDAIEIANNGDVWIATAESAAPNDVYRSTDNGETFAARGLHSASVWWKSVKAAPSDPSIVYVAGYQVAGEPKARLYRSDGDQWIERALTVKVGATPIVNVAAIDPRQPSTLYLVSLEASPPKGDRLYRSTDAGVTFTEVLATPDKVRDVVIAQDGSVYVATLATGVWRATDGVTFAKLAASPQTGCLGQRSDGALIACAANWEPDQMAVARSAEGGWQKVMQFTNLAGPPQCAPATTVGTLCAPAWPQVAQMFGAQAPANCPAVAEDPPKPEARPKPGGCCDGGSPTSLGTALALICVRRRRGSTASAARRDRS